MVDHSFGGPWTEIKLDAVEYYLQCYTKALKRANFDLTYIDAFAGTGTRDVEREVGGILEGVPLATIKETLKGSARRAIGVRPAFDHFVFIEMNRTRYAALSEIAAEFLDLDIKIIRGEANKVLHSLVRDEPWIRKDKSRSRGVVFLDPYALHVDWETLQTLASTRVLDVWYLFPIRDTIRQLARDFSGIGPKESMLDRLVGSENSIHWVRDRQRIRTYCWMFAIAFLFVRVLCGCFRSRRRLEAEILVLRHQLNVLQQRAPRRLYLTWADRALFVWLYRGFPRIVDAITIVRPETIVRWHRKGFRAFWRWRSRPLGGRPQIAKEVRDLIRRMSFENPLWGAPHIHGELLKLGFDVAQSTVSKYMVPRRGRPSQTWKTFLHNHADGIASIDLFVVPTIAFEQLFAFLILGHGRRQLLWFAVTQYPTAEWLARQITEAFPWDRAPTYIVRDNDRTFGNVFTRRIQAMGIRDRPTSFRSPWQNGHIERLIGSIRRECTDHLIVLNEEHLRRILAKFAAYYNGWRPHVSLGKDAPNRRPIEPFGDLVAHAILGGLHHRYTRI